MIESMACGTPVIAFARGSVPEVMRDGVSGYVVHDVEGAVRRWRRFVLSVGRAAGIILKRDFLAGRMAADYVAIYTRGRCSR